MLSAIAEFYVNIIEPGLVVLAVFLACAMVLYIFNFLRGGKKDDVVTLLVNSIFKGLVKSMQLIGKALLSFVRFVMRTVQVLFATIRDFLKSEDL